MADPTVPDAATREHLLAALAELVAKGGAGPLLAAPIEPERANFPERWRATANGVTLLLRRLAAHAGLARTIVVTDDRIGAPPTVRRPATQVELVEVRANELAFSLVHIGQDDAAGTLAHEIGVAFAAIHRSDEHGPYRSTSPGEATRAGGHALREVDERDLERGTIAAVYLGLGALAANAAYQQYNSGRFNGGYVSVEYDVLRAGYLPMSAVAYLLAVQAVVRKTRELPSRLGAPQRDEARAWIDALVRAEGDGDLEQASHALRSRLGIPRDAEPVRRAPVAEFDDPGEPEDPNARAIAFRWRTNRSGAGFLVGSLLGVALATQVPLGTLWPFGVLGASIGTGFAAGRRARVLRCSRCLHVVPAGACDCPACNSHLRGDIQRLEDRLEAEEALDDEPDVEEPVPHDDAHAE